MDANRGELSLSILGGHREVEFITGQRTLVTARENACGYNRQLVTYRGHVSPVVLPALNVAIEIPVGSTDDEVCGQTTRPSSEDDVYACRIPAPRGKTDASRITCASEDRLKFDYVDEYFQPRAAERVQYADLGVATNDADGTGSHVRFRFTAPFCLREVKIGPTDNAAKSLQDIVDPQNNRTGWVGDRNEFLLLRDPAIIEVEGDIFDGTCVRNDNAIFVEDDQVTLKFELVEVYPRAGPECEWPWDYTASCSLDLGNIPTLFSRALSDIDPASKDAIQITYLDGITGTDVMADAVTYKSDVSSDYGQGNDRIYDFRPGFLLNATATDPSPFAPFTVDVTVIFNREFDGSYVVFDRRAILVGTISEDVPQTLTMTTEPTLIFSILRDPPGGT